MDSSHSFLCSPVMRATFTGEISGFTNAFGTYNTEYIFYGYLVKIFKLKFCAWSIALNVFFVAAAKADPLPEEPLGLVGMKLQPGEGSDDATLSIKEIWL